MNLIDLVPILVPIACGCVLPILLAWFGIRKKMNDTNKRTEIILAAIEKNPEMDIEVAHQTAVGMHHCAVRACINRNRYLHGSCWRIQS